VLVIEHDPTPAGPNLLPLYRKTHSDSRGEMKDMVMKNHGSRCLSHRARATVAVVALLGLACALASDPAFRLVGAAGPEPQDTTPNNHPVRNPGGKAATFSTRGSVNLTGEYFRPQGTNGRSCATCHVPEEAWSITPGTLQHLFDESGGTHPVFNELDANNPDVIDGSSTMEQRLAAYSMLISRGVFRRGSTPRANSEWELIAAEDPHGYANLGRLVHWRRAMPTINFSLGSATVNWDGGNSVGADQHAGLVNQATRNVTGGQQGSPAPLEIIADIVGFEESLSTAQLIVPGVGRLDSDGARGGPEALSAMSKVAGRFNLFDAWAGHGNPRRAQIARGQELFNGTNSNGRSCSACHNSANNGTNMGDLLFDIRTASEEARTPDLPLYTFRHRTTGEIRRLSDAGRGQVTGLWSDLGRFKTPTLRALAARPPYFHNGIAQTIDAVVRHYELHLGFVFTDQERADLVAFLNAL
jgi:cytochrome c peroxidase